VAGGDGVRLLIASFQPNKAGSHHACQFYPASHSSCDHNFSTTPKAIQAKYAIKLSAEAKIPRGALGGSVGDVTICMHGPHIFTYVGRREGGRE
jgi:hypothetical protein